jgi:4-amino-4-deoxy-L-arabinose transferase-like glycosyltransferase
MLRVTTFGAEKMDLSIDGSTKLTTGRGKAFWITGALILSAILAGWMLPAVPLDDHESFVSVTAREMLGGGSWIEPTFNGQPRLQKTPLSYWLVASIASVTGKVDEFAARLPSAVFAFLSAGAVLYFVNRWLSLRTALIATVVWATSIGYVHWSHSARPEMGMVFFVTLCLLSFYSAITSQDRRSRVVFMFIFWVSFALGNLAKGPAPVVYVLLPAGLYIVMKKEWRVIPKLLPIWGIIICLAIVLPWPLAAAYKVNWDVMIWKREFFDRLFGEYAAGRYPWYYYLGMIFKYTSPWCIFLPIALVAPFYKVWGEKRPVMKFLWLWFVADFVFLMLSGGKRQHYLLPLLPAMSILTAIMMEDMAFVRRVFTAKYATNILLGHILFFIGAAIAVPVYFAKAKLPELTSATVWVYVISLSVILGVTTIVAATLFVKRNSGAACVVVFCGITILMAHHYNALRNIISPDQQVKQFAIKVAEIVPPTDKAVSYGSVPSNFVHYFGRTVKRIQGEAELNNLYQQGYWVVSFGKAMNELTNTGRYGIVYSDTSAKQRGTNVAAGGVFHVRPAVIKSSE